MLDERIDKACHALSIDDQRTTFHPLLWDELETDGFNESNTTDNEVRLKFGSQVHTLMSGAVIPMTGYHSCP